MNARLQARLLKAVPSPAKPRLQPIAPPKYDRVPLSLCGIAIDRREQWRQKFEAHQAELLRAAAIERSASRSAK